MRTLNRTSTPCQVRDRAYSHLLKNLQGDYTAMPAALRLEILAFYCDRTAPKSGDGKPPRPIPGLD